MVPLAATGPDTTVIAAFAVGFVSFISPCVLPLVPGYLSAVSGVSVIDIRAGRPHASRTCSGPAIVFCLSFTIMFVALGMTATGLGSTLRDSKETLDNVAGILIIAMGVFFLLTPFVPRLNQEWRPDALIRRAGTGGPIIAGARLRGRVDAVRRADAGLDPRRGLDLGHRPHGGVLLAFYSLGLAVPVPAHRRRLRPGDDRLRAGSATTTCSSPRSRRCVLIVMGILILTGELTQLNVQAQKALSDLGLDFLYKV